MADYSIFNILHNFIPHDSLLSPKKQYNLYVIASIHMEYILQMVAIHTALGASTTQYYGFQGSGYVTACLPQKRISTTFCHAKGCDSLSAI